MNPKNDHKHRWVTMEDAEDGEPYYACTICYEVVDDSFIDDWKDVDAENAYDDDRFDGLKK